MDPFRRSAGPLLISFAPAEFPVAETTLAPGDRVVLYTDGLVEAMRTDEDLFGVERLSALVARRGGAPDGLVADVFDAVATFAGRPGASFEDDCTLILVETVPRAGPASVAERGKISV